MIKKIDLLNTSSKKGREPLSSSKKNMIKYHTAFFVVNLNLMLFQKLFSNLVRIEEKIS